MSERMCQCGLTDEDCKRECSPESCHGHPAATPEAHTPEVPEDLQPNLRCVACWLRTAITYHDHCPDCFLGWGSERIAALEAESKLAHAPEVPEDLRVRCYDCGGMQIWKREGAEIVVYHSCFNGKKVRERIAALEAQLAIARMKGIRDADSIADCWSGDASRAIKRELIDKEKP